jgi:hypothetical protein
MRGRPRAPFLIRVVSSEPVRRLLTLALAAGLAALVAVALVDALRDSAEPKPPAETGSAPGRARAPWLEDADALAARLRRNRVTGTLYLSADRCLDGTPRRLRALSLPELELSDGPLSQTCSFTVSADGAAAAGREAVWSPQDPLFAAATGPNGLALIDPGQPGQLELEGSAPAFKPDGTFTYLSDGDLVEWTSDCAAAKEVVPPSSPGPDFGPVCLRTVVTAAELASALPPHVMLRSVEALAWPSDSLLTTVLEAGDRMWLAAFENSTLVRQAVPYVRGAETVRADPSGTYVGILANGSVEVYDRDGGIPWGSPQETLAFDWSPGGAWLAYATPDTVYLVRTADWATMFRFTVATEALAWRR